MKSFILPALLILFLTGCVSTPPNAEFLKTTNFSALQDFRYERTHITGMDFRESEELLLRELSESILKDELIARAFDEVETNADFYVVTKWEKAVSMNPRVFNQIGDHNEASRWREESQYQLAPRLSLTVELYESSTDDIFWRKEVPDVFDALEFTEARIIDSLRLAILNFPNCVEQDPNLPVFE